MKKLHLVFLALVAVFAFSALSVASASAVTFLLAEWLVKGAAVAATLAAEGTGELTLEDVKGGLFLEDAGILCSGILVGTVETASKGTITELLTLALASANGNEPLAGSGVECSTVLNCPEPAKAYADDLPWSTEVELAEEGAEKFFANLILPNGKGNPGWESTCFGVEDLCSAPEAVAQLLLNAAGTVLQGEFSEAFRTLMGAPAAECTRGGLESGLVFSDTEGPINLQGNTEELTASSETETA